MYKFIRSVYTFYLSHFYASLAISLSAIWMYSVLGNSSIPILCWYKVVTMVIVFYATNSRKHKEFYYYQNLGISKRWLWGTTLTVDGCLFIVLMILTYRFSHA